jgi:AraC-like DNA-binding protein
LIYIHLFTQGGGILKRKVKVLWVEKAEWPQGWGVRAHTHEYYHLFYFLSGQTTFIVDGIKYNTTKGACFIVPPNTVHEIQKVTNNTVTCYEIKFSLYDQLSIDYLSDSGYEFIGNEFLEDLILYIVNNGLSRVPVYIDTTEAFLYTLIVYLTREYYETNNKLRNSQLIDTTGFSDVTVSIIIYIEENYTRQINLDMIAKSIGYNKNYICSVFKKDTEISIIDYLSFVRIRQAAVYFSYSDIDISLVCARVGFANISHFNRTFKKFIGLSPTTFKKMYPLDLNGSLGNDENMSSILGNQITSIAEAFGIFQTSN